MIKSKEEQPCVNPIEEQRKSALKHYHEASAAIHHWNSFVEAAIKAYNPAFQFPSQGLKWVKASERLPEDGRYYCRFTTGGHIVMRRQTNLIDGRFEDDGYAVEQYTLDEIEWLDESAPSQGLREEGCDIGPEVRSLDLTSLASHTSAPTSLLDKEKIMMAGYRVGVTIGNNICMTASDRYNDDDKIEAADALNEAAKRIRGYLNDPSFVKEVMNEYGTKINLLNETSTPDGSQGLREAWDDFDMAGFAGYYSGRTISKPGITYMEALNEYKEMKKRATEALKK